MSALFTFDNTYAHLPESFYQKTSPENVVKPALLKFNHDLAKELGIDVSSYDQQHIADILSGQELVSGSQPLAQAYAGHQFGGLSPQLGDGRALLLGEIINSRGQRVDIQLKGSGRTAFSRGGDGKATLYSVLREYLIAEAMQALNIPTTRSLAVVATGESIVRDGIAVPGAVLTRVAASHIRVGTFQYFAIRGETDLVRQLADYTIDRHYPELMDSENPYLALLDKVIEKQIELIVQWYRVGFIHGVMNTDNTTVSGESIDFGPCAFMDTYNPDTVFSSIDRRGRYAYGNQGPIGYWNLTRFAETLVTLVDEDEQKAVQLLTDTLESYPERFHTAWLQMMGVKIGITLKQQEDASLAGDFLNLLQENNLDYTRAFRFLTDMLMNGYENDGLYGSINDSETYADWKQRWMTRLDMDTVSQTKRIASMQKANPVYIARNWYVEQALTAAVEGDFSLFDELFEVLQKPYDVQQNREKYAQTPVPSGTEYKTFCGT